jgi:hypothetical protein
MEKFILVASLLPIPLKIGIYCLFMVMYSTELILFQLTIPPGYYSFKNRPTYESLEIDDSQEYHYTLVQEGITKDCGDYKNFTYEMELMLNNEYVTILCGFAFYMYYIVSIIVMIIETVDDFVLGCIKQSKDTENIISCIKEIYFPITKTILIVLCYPFANFTYGECIEGKGQFFLRLSFYASAFGTIIFFNGFVIFMILYYLPKKKIKYMLLLDILGAFGSLFYFAFYYLGCCYKNRNCTWCCVCCCCTKKKGCDVKCSLCIAAIFIIKLTCLASFIFASVYFYPVELQGYFQGILAGFGIIRCLLSFTLSRLLKNFKTSRTSP